MLIHVVCWKYKLDVSPAERDDHRARLSALADIIPGIISLEVGADILHLDRSFDTGLVATFPDAAVLETYSADQRHQVVAALGKELAEKVVSVDFISEK